MSIITLYVNEPNSFNKRQELLVKAGWEKKKLYVVYKSYMLLKTICCLAFNKKRHPGWNFFNGKIYTNQSISIRKLDAYIISGMMQIKTKRIDRDF